MCFGGARQDSSAWNVRFSAATPGAPKTFAPRASVRVALGALRAARVRSRVSAG